MGQAMAQAMGAATSGGGGASATTRADAGAAGGAGAPGAAGAASTASDAPVGILCGRCRARLERATRFCPECGAQLA
jgi:hypothetical protein